jgi:hypothetical protein
MLLATFVECLAAMVPQEKELIQDAGELKVRQAEEIASAIGVEVRSLQRSFKRVRGQSPGQVFGVLDAHGSEGATSIGVWEAQGCSGASTEIHKPRAPATAAHNRTGPSTLNHG